MPVLQPPLSWLRFKFIKQTHRCTWIFFLFDSHFFIYETFSLYSISERSSSKSRRSHNFIKSLANRVNFGAHLTTKRYALCMGRRTEGEYSTATINININDFLGFNPDSDSRIDHLPFSNRFSGVGKLDVPLSMLLINTSRLRLRACVRDLDTDICNWRGNNNYLLKKNMLQQLFLFFVGSRITFYVLFGKPF